MIRKGQNQAVFIRRLLIALFLFVTFPIFPHKASALNGEEITNFESRIWIQPSGEIVVTETITANCLGNRIKHGIYRDIPIVYRKGLLMRMRPMFHVLSVEIDGSRAPYHTNRRGGSIRIYMGSKGSYVSKGLHTFKLTYEMGRMVRFFSDFDELYWNVTGDEWAFPIQKATCTIILPEPSRFIRFATYTGRRGSQGTMARVGDQTGKSITFETTRPLAPGQGFTVAVAWPKGIVIEPSSFEKFLYLLKDNFSILSGVILLLCTILYYAFAWLQVGKDPEIGPVVPRFDPPRNIGPGAARFIRQMGFDDKIFATTLVSLATKGLVELKKDKKGFTAIRKGDEAKAPLSAGEEELLTSLFYPSSTVSLDNSNYKKISSAKKKLKNSLKRNYEKVYFLTNQKYLIPGLVLSVLAIVALALGGQEIVPGIFISVWLSVWTFFSLFLLWNGIKGLKGFFAVSLRQKASAIRNLIVSLFFSVGLWVGGTFYAMMIGPIGLALFFAIILLNIIFYQLMKAPTMKGASILSELEGFKMFLKTAEAPRLEALIPPGKAPELFEKYLPWAMALDVENQWAENFQRYLEKIGQASTYRPAWYHGSYYNLSSISSDVGTGLGSAISMASFSNSSGSGGGGFSGGGGGGGGGGGW